MYSGENDVLWFCSGIISTPEKLKNMPEHGGTQTYGQPTELRGQVGLNYVICLN